MLVYFLTYAAVALYRHWGLNSSGLDLAIQAQVLWNTAHGRFYETTIEVNNFLGDHVALIALPLSLLAWLPGDLVEWMLIVQTIALGSAAWPLYRLALSETGSRTWAAVIPAAFLVYPVLGFINRFDFHFLVFCTPCLCWMLLFVRQGRLKAATFAAVLACMCREEVGVAVACAAFYAALTARPRRAWGLSVGAAALGWSLIALLALIPFFRGGQSDTLDRYAWLGAAPGEIVVTFLTSPLYVLHHFVMDPYRIHTLGFFVWPLVFLHWLSPRRLLCVAPSLLVCMLADSASQNSIYFQYLAPVLPLLWWAVIGGAARLTRWSGPARRRFVVPVAAGLLGAGVTAAFIFQTPITMLIERPCWQVQVGPPRPNVAAFQAAADLVGPEDSVYATMALAPHLAERRELSIAGVTPMAGQSNVVLLDVTDWRWLALAPEYKPLLASLIENQSYGIEFWQDGIVLLRRGSPSIVDRAAVLRVLEQSIPAPINASMIGG